MSEKTLEELVKSLNILAAQGMELLHGKQVPKQAEPPIEPGTIVWAWDGDIRPTHPRLGKYSKPTEDGHEVLLGSSIADDNDGGWPSRYEHVEPYRAPIRWDKIHYADEVAFFDSGAVRPRIDSCSIIGEVSDMYGTVIAIEYRPGTNGDSDE